MLENYRHILVATDLTPNSVFAFQHAVMLARLSNAQLHLLHVLPEVDASIRSYVSTIMGPGNLDRFEMQHEEQARSLIKSRLEKFAREELAGKPEDLQRVRNVLVKHGHPAALILQLADQLEVDVIVMGTHGKGAMEYTFLGSIAKRVVRKSRIPVLLVPLLD